MENLHESFRAFYMTTNILGSWMESELFSSLLGSNIDFEFLECSNVLGFCHQLSFRVCGCSFLRV